MELLEVSLVPVPANQDAILMMASKGFKKAYTFVKSAEGKDELIEIDLPELKNAVRYSEHPENMKVDEESEWDGRMADMSLRKWASSDGSGNKDKMIWSKYRKGFAWYDANVIDNFTSYKFPHHYVKDNDFYVSFRGCVSAMVYLDRANIPAEDRKGVYNHLAKHYKEDFNREPPAYKEKGRNLIEAIKDYDNIHLAEYLKLVNPDEFKELINSYEEVIKELTVEKEKIQKENEELKNKINEISFVEGKNKDVSPSEKEAENKETSEEVVNLDFTTEEVSSIVKDLLKKILKEEF